MKEFNFLTLSMIVTLIMPFQLSLADDCGYSKNKLEIYLTNCAGIDGCANKDRVIALASQACGTKLHSSAAASVASHGDGDGDGGGASSSSQSAKTPEPKENYAGEACAYFTRPSIESSNGVTRMNYYGNGASSCYQGKMYKCSKRRWEFIGSCSAYSNWESLSAEKQENSHIE